MTTKRRPDSAYISQMKLIKTGSLECKHSLNVSIYDNIYFDKYQYIDILQYLYCVSLYYF